MLPGLVTIAYVANAAAALALILVGALLFVLKPARAGVMGFAAFALCAGAQHFFGNLAGVAFGTAWGPLLAMMRYPFLLVAPMFLIWATASYRGRAAVPWVAPFVAVALVAGAIMAIQPSVLFTSFGFEETPGHFLLTIPYFTAMALAAVLLVAHHKRETSPRLRLEILLLVGAFLPYLAYTAGVTIPLLWGNEFFPTIVTNGYLVMFGGCLVVVAWTSAALWRTGERGARVLAAVDVAAAVAGFTQSTLIAEWAFFGGVLRFFAALLLGYALLKYRIFDIDLRVKKGLARTIVASVALTAFFLVSELAESVVADGTGSTIAGLSVAAAFVILETRVTHIGRKIADRALPRVVGSNDYLQERKHVVYRAAMESASRDGTVTPRERKILQTLARELGLTPEDMSRIEQDVTRAVA